MKNENRTNFGEHSFTELFRELSLATTSLVRSELGLLKEEMKQTGTRFASHAMKAALFGALLALSAIPFLAFLVIGLGDLLNGRYWLSSLIVAVVCAGVGGIFAIKAFRDIKEQDLELPHSKSILEREKEVLSRKIHEMKDATHRRAI
jgi:hypothetical protein